MNTGGMELKLEVPEKVGEELLNHLTENLDKQLEEVLKIYKQLNDFRCLKKKELAELVGVSIQTIEKWMKLGLPYFQIDNVIIYNVVEIMAWLKNFKKGEDK